MFSMIFISMAPLLPSLLISMALCEHTSILRALVKYPQGNLEEIQEKTLQSTQEEPGGRQDRKAQAYATECYTASHTASANTGEAICTRVLITSPPRPPPLGGRTYVRTYPRAGQASNYTVSRVVETRATQG
jgi:hypothetical protein